MNPILPVTPARTRAVRRASIVTVVALMVSSLIGLTGIGAETSPATAAVLDAAAYPLKFNSANRVGISPAGNVGTNVNDIVRYNAVTTINGTVVDAVIRVVANSGAVITMLDNGGAVASSPPGSPQTVGDLLQTDLTTTASQMVTLDIDFYEGGTYTGVGSGVPVTLANVKLSTYDIDAGAANRQYVDFRGFQSYLVYTGPPTGRMTISSEADGFVRFAATLTNTSATATSGSYSWARAQVNYDRTSGMQVRLGVLATGGGFFALDFSAGGIWTTDGTTAVTPTETTNPNNRPPTTADNLLVHAAENASTVLTAADFPYADLDDNAMASIRIVTVPSPTVATLEYFDGTGWQTVTDGFVITTTDLDLGKLRLTTTDVSGSFTFQVNDGLAYSGTSTLSYTAEPLGQTITFANPGTRAPSATFASNATASSGLTPTLTSQTPSVCTVSGLDIVTAALPSGVTTAICVITATQEGDDYYGRADAVTQQFSISALLPQTITFADPGDRPFSTTPIVTGVAATPSGLPVTLATLTPSVCTVSGGSITPVTLGTCSVRATQSGNGTYAPAPPVTQTFNLLPATQSITFAQPADQAINGGPLVVAPTASSGLTSTLTSDTPAVCSVTGMSIAFLATGVCTVTATQAGDATYGAAAPVTRSFDIDLAAQSITFAQPVDQQFADGPLVIAPTASSGLSPVLTSDSPTICSVSGTSVSFLAPGECTITATQPGDSTFAAAPAVSRSFDIGLVAQSIAFAQPADQDMGDGPLVVAPTASSGLTPVLSSSTPAVCTVSGMSISLLSAGECAVTADQAGDSTYAAAASVTRSFDVSLVPQTITFAQPADQEMGDGPLVVAPTASSGLTPVLSSSTPTVCTVSGMSIAFLGAGTCTIDANQPGNDTYDAAPVVSRSFAIATLSQAISFSQPSDQVIDDGPLVVAPAASSGLTPVLSSSTPAVCSVSGMSISFLSAGECTVTANQPGNATYDAAAPVTRSFDISLVPQTITFAQPADQEMGDGPLVVAPTASSGLTPVLSSSTPTVCTVSGMSIDFLSAGICTIDANQPGNATYDSAPVVSRSFDIDLVAQAITFAAPADQQIGAGSLIVAPTTSSGLTALLASGTPAVCTVSGFTITFVTIGECTVTASQPGDGTYAAATSVTHSFDIATLGQTITFPQPSDVSLDDPAVTLVATTDAAGLTPSLASTTTAVCTVTGFSVSFVGTGICTITAGQEGDATYAAAAPVARSFRVLEITTKSLPSMTSGTAVSRQLAVAGAAGGGTWSTPDALPAGVSLNPSTGVLSGTPTVAFSGTVTFVYTENGVAHEQGILLSVSAAAGAPGAAALAHSGTDSVLAVGIGILLLLLGGVAMMTTTRRRSAAN